MIYLVAVALPGPVECCCVLQLSSYWLTEDICHNIMPKSEYWMLKQEEFGCELQQADLPAMLLIYHTCSLSR